MTGSAWTSTRQHHAQWTLLWQFMPVAVHSARDVEADHSANLGREGINHVSKALTRGRESLGEFENYGERLYVEGLLEMDRRRQQARWLPLNSRPVGHTSCSVSVRQCYVPLLASGLQCDEACTLAALLSRHTS